MKNIIVALDGLSKEQAFALVENTHDLVWGFKVHELIVREGFEIIKKLKPFGGVFVDFKFHDIPQTVEYEVAALTEYGADLITVHASGGKEMLESAVKAGGERVVAISALTSLSEESATRIYGTTTGNLIQRLAELAKETGVKNIVCAAPDIHTVRTVYPTATLITPGIRQEKTEDDQKRTMTAHEAMSAGANLLVVGRPITKAPDPRSALLEIISTLS